MMDEGPREYSKWNSALRMKSRIFAALVSITLVSCGEDPGRIINRGGTLYPDTVYDFKLMVIEEIRASEKASFCNIRPRGQDKYWPDLTFEGDLGDFKNGDVVDVKIRGVEIVNISDAWPTTDFMYKFASPLFGHRTSVFIAKYVLHGAMIIYVLFLLLARLGSTGGKKSANS